MPSDNDTKNNQKLSDLINIGKEVEKQLNQVDVTTPEELRKIGSREAWLRIRAIDESACINRLYGLEGAIRNIRWHYLPDEDKKELKEFYLKNK